MRFLLAITCLAIVSAGCATKPVHNERAGLFDRLNQGSTGRRIEPVKIGRIPYRKPSDELRKLPFRWPLANVEVTSHYGNRGDGFHEGVDLRAKVGTPVYAAQDGLVLHSGGQISGYGKMIVVRHAGGWSTIYAHNSKLLVKQGQKVKKGQKIAVSGQTGRTSGPHLHFEVRNGLEAYDPFEIIGKPEIANRPERPKATKVAYRAPSKASQAKSNQAKSKLKNKPKAQSKPLRGAREIKN